MSVCAWPFMAYRSAPALQWRSKIRQCEETQGEEAQGEEAQGGRYSPIHSAKPTS
jgi:hypothetical protein